jgi:type I restriction enzyme R subunit
MTTNKITESAIEELAIALLEKQGYQYIYAPDIAPDSETPERTSFDEVLLLDRLRKAVGRINQKIPADAREDAIKQILRLNSPELIANNEAFHKMLTEGITVSYQKDGADRGDLVWLLDFNNPENNDCRPTNRQYPVFLVTMASWSYLTALRQRRVRSPQVSAGSWPGNLLTAKR